jgi:cellulose synthase/poly-beta-1,6-N-acetylglucosamine synthase-like glycosyltransferase
METKLKIWESTLDSCLGANGAIYAIRPELFWRDIPDNTIVDDLVIGMKVREQGFRMLYDTSAVATEELPQISDEWTRRVRIGCGDYQAIGLCKASLSPRFGTFAWIFWSHKIMRWFTPHIIIAATAISLVSITISLMNRNYSIIGIPSLIFSAGITLFAIAAVAGRFLQKADIPDPISRLSSTFNHFLTMNLALFVGFARFCRGTASGSWKRTPRNIS